jgi:predicted DNA-binding transcriptional regulator YafY
LVETRRTMPDATHAMLAQALGVSATTVARDVAMLDTADVAPTTGGRNGR